MAGLTDAHFFGSLARLVCFACLLELSEHFIHGWLACLGLTHIDLHIISLCGNNLDVRHLSRIGLLLKNGLLNNFLQLRLHTGVVITLPLRNLLRLLVEPSLPIILHVELIKFIVSIGLFPLIHLVLMTIQRRFIVVSGAGLIFLRVNCR